MTLLPGVVQEPQTLTVETATGTVLHFTLRPIPGPLWSRIITSGERRLEDALDADMTLRGVIGVEILTAGIADVRADDGDLIEWAPPTWVLVDMYDPRDPKFGWPDIGPEDERREATAAAKEAMGWPPAMSERLLLAVELFNTRGPLVDPFYTLKPSARAAKPIAATTGTPESPATSGWPSPTSNSGTTDPASLPSAT